MKNISRRITSLVLVMALVASFLGIAGTVVKTSASGYATFSLNIKSESNSEVVLEVRLDSGSFSGLDFGIEHNYYTIKECTQIKTSSDIAQKGGVQAANADTGMYSGALFSGYSKAGGVIATYTYTKNYYGVEVTESDFELYITNCVDESGYDIYYTVKNNLPVYEEVTLPPTEPETEPIEPSTEPYYPEYPEYTDYPDYPDYPDYSDEPSVDISENSTEIPTVPVINNTGSCGDNATWVFNTVTGELVISGSGDMWDYTEAQPEWTELYGDEIKKITICEGITAVGANSFDGCNVAEIVYVASSVKEIRADAFKNCVALNEVHYGGSEEDFENVAGNEVLKSDKIEISFNEEPPTQPTIPLVDEEGDSVKEEERENKKSGLTDSQKKTIIVIAVAAFLVEAIIVVVVLTVKKNKNKNKNNTEPKEY